jgi:transcriptional regulator with XRE-family HTH domain
MAARLGDAGPRPPPSHGGSRELLEERWRGGAIVRPTSFGALLRINRLAANLTQRELAERAGLSEKAVSSLEGGHRKRPRPHTLRALAEALGLSGAALADFMQAARASAEPVREPAARAHAERVAAWELYVELVTRTAVSGLRPQEGMLREALSSLYSLFDSVRSILRKHGPALALANEEGTHSFAGLAVDMLNHVLRPLLSKWHPLLLDYEESRPPGVSPAEHERAWARNDELRAALAGARSRLAGCARQLAAVAGVPHGLSEM